MLLSLLYQQRALLTLTGLSTAILLFRIYGLSEAPCADWMAFPFCPKLRLGFLLWNAFLAWVPVVVLALPAARHRHSLIRWTVLGIAILFFPNAPYLITDLIHLRAQAGVPLWYDALLLFSFAYLGLLLALYALTQIREILKQTQSRLIVEGVTVLLFLLSGLGVYLGRVLRWNSWDAFFQPQGPVRDTLRLLQHPLQHKEAWLMIILFSLLLACVYWVRHTDLQLHKKSPGSRSEASA